MAAVDWPRSADTLARMPPLLPIAIPRPPAPAVRSFGWPTASLRVYLIGMILVASLPIAALLGWQLYRSVATEDARTQAELSRMATAVAAGVEAELLASIDSLAIFAQGEASQGRQLASFERQLRERKRLRPTWSGEFLADAGGRLLFASDGTDHAIPSLWLQSVDLSQLTRTGVPLISDLLPADRDGRFWTVVAVPVMVDGEARGVLGALIPSSVWQQLVERGAPRADGFVSVFDRDKRVIARSLAPDRFVGRFLPAAAVASMANQPSGFHRTTLLGGGDTYGAWQQVALAGWGVGVGVAAAPIDAQRRAARWTAASTVAACMLAGLLCALLVARRVTKPLEQLANGGPLPASQPIVVREIAHLRDALDRAARSDLAAHELLQHKAGEFETLFRSSPIGLAFAEDTAAESVMLNPALEQLLAPGSDGQPPTVWHHDLLLPLERQPLQRAAAFGESTLAIELELRAPGRPTAFVQAGAVPLLDRDGRPRGAVGAMVDISDRRRSEAQLIATDQRLRQSQRLMDLAQEAGHAGFFHYHFASDSLTWTPGQANLFGLAAGQHETSLTEWVRRVEAGDRARIEQGVRAALAAQRERESFDFRVRHGEQWRWLSCRVLVSYHEQQPQQMIGVTVDITDQKLVEQERGAAVEREQAARLQAEAANRTKDEFLAMLSHELRNPLSAMSAAIAVLDRDGIRTELAAEARTIIARQTRHLARLMDDLLDVSRLISGKILLSCAPLELAALVGAVAATARLTLADGRQRIEVDATAVWVDADHTRVEQVLGNLLTNALRYTPPEGSIKLAVRADGADALIEVDDTGVGIPADLLPRVFDLFVQGERSIDRRAGGLGIGLTLVKRLVELHDGTVAVTSSAGGTRFAIRLPAIPAPRVSAAPALQVPPTLRRRVLLVEDNADALLAMQIVLDLDGHEVHSAADGETGLARLLAIRPEVAVVDIGLPGLNGFELARSSRARGFTGRLIAISGYGQDRDIERARQAGFDAHLVKPVDIDALRALLTAQD